ncbi:MAG: helix-turn-helix domain-containing protein [Erysipelotrichaceae bacterium]|nr:helix-turn-helix domain-containing protein [Erysipelotrichaceae bacterium]
MNLTHVGERITKIRKQKGLSQNELADMIGISAQAISKWENGRNLPDIENLLILAELLNVPYEYFLMDEEEVALTYPIRARYFKEENMYTRIKGFAQAEQLNETYKALSFMKECHAGQFRKPGHFTSEKVQYINHPLLMCCQAHALGIRDDNLLASILLHDVIEDTGVSKKELPFNDEIKEIVSLVSFIRKQDEDKNEAKRIYYENILTNPKACVVKIIDRCNNVSNMAAAYSKEKMMGYVVETEEYVLPLAIHLKKNYPEYSDVVFLVRYQIIAILETVKNLVM